MSPGLAARLNVDLSTAAERAHDSLVRVVSRRRGVGAGVVWDKQGLVVTNAHVVERGKVAVALSDGRQLDARVVASDTAADVAVLSVEDNDLKAIEVGDARDLRAGELVFALGYPWGITDAVTSGVVIGVGDEWDVTPPGQAPRDWLVVNMRLRPGNSGGPIVDSRGRLVGLSTIMAGPEMGMAVPSHVASRLVGTI